MAPDKAPVQNEGENSKREVLPVRTNIVSTPLEGPELAKIRYHKLADDLLKNRLTNQAQYKFQFKGTQDKDYDENKDLIKAKGTLNPDKSLTLEGNSWKAIIKPNGEIKGRIPNNLLQFLSYNKVEYNESYNGKTTHNVSYSFIEKGQAMITSPIYNDKEKNTAEDILKQLF
jgi:hypothetical protein